MHVSNVGKPILVPVPFIFIKELTLERNLMHVYNVGKPFLVPVTFRDIEELTL
jgi:hypothetical protein